MALCADCFQPLTDEEVRLGTECCDSLTTDP